MLSCKEAAELMSQEQDRPLAMAERLLLRLHVLVCTGCDNYRRQLRVLRAACRHLSGGAP